MFIIWVVPLWVGLVILFIEAASLPLGEPKEPPRSWKYQLAPIVPVLGAFSYFRAIVVVVWLLGLLIGH
jgi:hypothetical protein